MNFDCGICYEEYDSKEQIPCIGTCGHSICDRCRTSMFSSKCPHCNRSEAFAVKHVNKQLWDLIQFSRYIFRNSKIQEEQISSDTPRCNSCDIPSKKLRICYNCCLDSGLIKKYKRDGEEEDDLEESIQKIQEQALCGDCIIDGDHFGHKTEYVDSFVESYSDFLRK